MRYSYRVDILRNGVKFGELPCVAPYNVSMKSDAEICLTLSGSFKRNEDMNYLTDLIEPHIILDGADYALGRYVIGTRRTVHDGTSSTDEIEAYDMALLLKQTRAETLVSFASGVAYMDAIQSLMIADDIRNVMATPCNFTFASARADWEIGTDYLTIVNALLKEINYDALWFDLRGTAHLEPYAAPSVDNIKHKYSSGEMSVIKAESTSEIDMFDTPNVFVATRSNPELPTWRKESVNDSPSSILSTICRGRRIMAPVITLDNVPTEAALQRYVDDVKMKSMLSTETVKFTTAINPTHSVGDTVALSHERLSGIFEETEWTITPGSQMTHCARRVTYL